VSIRSLAYNDSYQSDTEAVVPGGSNFVLNNQILSSEWLNHVRLRPGMYIGGIDLTALHRMAEASVRHSLDKAFADEVRAIQVTLLPNCSIRIVDDGKGLPVSRLPSSDKSVLEMYLTSLGAALDDSENIVKSYPSVSGSWTAMIPVVNALSAEFQAEIRRNGYLWQQAYALGVPKSDLIQLRPLEPDETTGTQFTFRPDFTIFEPNEFSYTTIAELLRDLAYFLPGVAFTLRDERGEQVIEERFHSENGVADFVAALNKGPTSLHPIVSGSREVEYRNQAGILYKVSFDFALQYADDSQTILRSYANTEATPEHGIHVFALLSAIADFANQYEAIFPGRFKGGLDRNAVLKGLTAVVHLKHPNTSFAGAIRREVINSDVYGLVGGFVYETLASQTKDISSSIIEKCISNRRRKGAANTRPSPE
jgi:DNA gyrase subunit B